MRHSQHHVLLAAALATGVAFAMPPTSATAFAGNDVAATTDPGFGPNSGQINRGFDEKVATSAQARQIPTPAQARAVTMMPDSDQPALGPPGADASTNAGSGPPAAAASGPIGATGQTMPAKFSQRNDILDRVQIMALPLPLSDQDRQRIFQAVMADKTPTANDAAQLVPASELDVNQALNETHPLPASVSAIGGVQALGYVKTKNKVFLVEPASRIVVEEIGS